MFDSKRIDDMARRLTELMPASVRAFQADIEKNLRAGLQGVLAKMDLVTREEFEVQAALLTRSRERLGELEARVQALEQRSAPAPRESGGSKGKKDSSG